MLGGGDDGILRSAIDRILAAHYDRGGPRRPQHNPPGERRRTCSSLDVQGELTAVGHPGDGVLDRVRHDAIATVPALIHVVGLFRSHFLSHVVPSTNPALP